MDEMQARKTSGIGSALETTLAIWMEMVGSSLHCTVRLRRLHVTRLGPARCFCSWFYAGHNTRTYLRSALLFNRKDSGTGIASGGGDFGGVHGSCGNLGIGEAGCSIGGDDFCSGGGAAAIGGWDPARLGADERA